jgi:DNA-binding XRE family transcriptional regulator
MRAHTKKHLTESNNNVVYATDGVQRYAIPRSVAEKYRIESNENKQQSSAAEVFNAWDRAYTKAGALLKGVRAREGMSQVEFAKAIDVTQSNLSKMECGKRAIGKRIARRIEEKFGVNYKYFLE